MWMLLVIVLLTACSDHSGESSDETGDCFLNIYVYAPERPMLTRADVGDIASKSVEEHMVHTLQIWVFKQSNGDLVGYLETKPTFLNETNGQEMFQMKVKKEFADHPENVDVYVVANAYVVPDEFDKFINYEKNYDLIYIDKNNEEVTLTLGESTTRAQLDSAKIGVSSFGVGNGTFIEKSVVSPVSKVSSAGLPMSGVLKNQPISGSYPTLRVGTQDAMATLQLTRAVSKLRFVLCQKKEKSTSKKKLVSIDKIELNGSVIPTASYLMPVTKPSYKSYVSTAINYGGIAKEAIPNVKDPMKYAYETQSAQEYENMIDGAIAGTYKAHYADSNIEGDVDDECLKEFGLTYLRESDKKLTGTITYSVKEREDVETNWENITEEIEKTATFSMADSGDFLRNHSWIVYVFYMDATIYTLTVTNIGMKSWASGGYEEKSVYNW